MANSIATKWFFSAEHAGYDPNNAVLEAQVDISGSGQAITNMARALTSYKYAEVISGSIAGKSYWVGVPYGGVAASLVTVLSGAPDAVGVTGSADIGTLSDKVTLGIRFVGVAAAVSGTVVF